MDKWTYRQLYRCAVGGNTRALEHWRRCGVDPHQKIESKYSSMTAHQYRALIEKDVAQACRTGLAALGLGTQNPVGPAANTPSVASNPFADYLNAIAPPKPKARSHSTSDLPAAVQPALAPVPSVNKSQTEVLLPLTPQAPMTPKAEEVVASAPYVPAVSPVFGSTNGSAGGHAAAIGLSAMPRPKAGAKKGGLGARKLSPGMPASDGFTATPDALPFATATASPSKNEPSVPSAPAEPAAAPMAPSATMDVASRPSPVAVVKAAPKPIKPITPVAARASTPASTPNLSDAWADLEASMTKQKPVPKGLPPVPLFSDVHVPPTSAPPPPATPTPAAPTVATMQSLATQKETTDAASLEPQAAPSVPVAVFSPLGPTQPRASSTGVALKMGSGAKVVSKKLGASRVIREPTASSEQAMSFDDFDFDNSPQMRKTDVAHKGPVAASANKVHDEADDGWGWADGASSAKTVAPTPSQPAVDDPWGEPRSGTSSLFAYEAPSLHAAPVAAPPARRARSPPRHQPEASAETQTGKDDVYGFAAREKYSNATAIGSSDFDQPPDKTAEEDEDLSPERDREKWLERFAGSTAISSADLMDDEGAHNSGLARKMASSGYEATKKLGGYAASYASSWLNRGSGETSPKK